MKAKTLCLPALAALLATQARAVDLTSTWTGLGVNNSWGSAANWNIAPTFGNNQIVVFTGTTRLLNAIAQDRTIKSLSYDANADNPFFNRLRNGTGDNEVGRVLTFQSDTGVSTISMDAGATASHQIITGTITSPGTAGRIVLANQLNVVQDSASVLTLADTATIISGGTGATINKSGTGILILGGTNTFTDAVNINAGTLRIGSGGTLGTNAGGTFVADGASLDVAGVKITTAGENISIIGNGVGGLGAFFSSTGNQAQSNVGVNLILTGDASVGVSGARNGVTSGTISSGGMNYTLTKVGPGQFDTEASSVNVGDIVVNQGIFQTAFVTTINTGFPIIVNSGAEFRMFELVNPLARNFALNGGTINSTASVNVTGDTISGNVTLTGSGTINSAGGTGDFLTISGNIGESAPGATLNIGGTQTVALAGTNTYTGATTVTSGALRASGTFTSDITISTGATLDGEGSTTGLLTLNDGANILFNPTTTGPNQHLRTNNVTVGGLIAVRPSTLGSGTNIVVLETTTGTLNPGDFYLLGSPGELSVGAGGTQLLYTNAGANLEWRALVDNIWGEFGPENFQNLTTASPSAFTSGDNVDFVNTGAGTVSLFGNILAGVVNFNNTAGNNFDIQPTAGETLTAVSLNHTSTGDVTIASSIAGTTPINKSGSGKLVLSGTNPSTGAIINSTGTLQIGDGVATNTTLGSTSLTNDGTLEFNIAGIPTLNITAPISGTGNIVQNGTSFVELQGTNTYTGTTTVNSGFLRFFKPASLYNGNTADWTPSKLVVNAGGSMGILLGAANFSTADFTTLLGNLVTGPVAGYKAGSTIVVNTNADSTIADNIPDSTGTGGGSIGFFKGGTAILTLTGTNTFTGGLSVNNGTLIGGDANFGNGAINMGIIGPTGGVLQLTDDTDNPINFSNGGTGTKVINLAAGVVDATLSGTINFAADGAPGTNGVSRISPLTGTLVISGKMTGTGTGGFAKRNFGTVVITNATNDYTGPTTIVDAGTLLVDGTVSSANVYFGPNIDGTGTGFADGILGGKGLISGNVITKAASNLSPGGTSAGGVNTPTLDTLTIGGTLDLTVSAAGTGKLIYQLGAPAASDKLVVGGLTLGTDALGFTDFTFTGSGGFAPGVYTLISSGTAISGTLDPANLSGTINGMTSTLSISGNDVILTVVNPTTPFQSWMTTYYPSITSPNNDPAVDFDGDGTSNFGEFAFGGAPDSGASAGPRRTAIDNIGGTDYITLTIATRTGTVFSGSAPATGSKDNVNYTVGGSLDLATFTESVTEVTPAITTGLPVLGSGPLTDYEYHTFRITAPRTAIPQAFLRAIAAP
jgi:autotransporter-associated beta strand protein